MTRVVVATKNRHKLAELRDSLTAVASLEVVGLEDCPGAPDVAETADSFAGNAELKARGIAQWVAAQGVAGDRACYVLADDSGLCVDALAGAPGVYSARFAGPQASDADNNRRLVAELEARDRDESPAHYVCVLALAEVGPQAPLIGSFEGRWDVTVRVQSRGTGGFGYDPHAWLGDRTVAELAPADKAALSHRGQALRALAAWWRAHGPGPRNSA